MHACVRACVRACYGPNIKIIQPTGRRWQVDMQHCWRHHNTMFRLLKCLLSTTATSSSSVIKNGATGCVQNNCCARSLLRDAGWKNCLWFTMLVFREATACRREDGRRIFTSNTGIHIPNYSGSHPMKQQRSNALPSEINWHQLTTS